MEYSGCISLKSNLMSNVVSLPERCFEKIAPPVQNVMFKNILFYGRIITMAENRWDPDIALFIQVADGYPGSFELLLQKYQARIFGQAVSYLKNVGKAEDIVQDVF